MRQLLFSLIALLIFSITLTACGGGSGTASDPENTLTISHDELSTAPAKAWDTYVARFKSSNKSISKVSADSGNALMNALVVINSNRTEHSRSSAQQSWNSTDSAQTINITRLLNSVALLTFDKQGYITRLIHIGSHTYTVDEFTAATSLSATSNNAEGNSLNGLDDADSGTLTVERGANFFGFDSDYMVYAVVTSHRAGNFTAANQALTEYKFDNDAIMLAGIQTADDHIPTLDSAEFNGKGKGFYGVVDEKNLLTRYHTSFTTNAIVDFSARTVDFTTTNTACVREADVSVNCADDNITASNLDFDLTDASALSFADGDKAVNKITADVTLDNGTLAGKLDARFYGAETEEFGGTFSLTESDKRYYYGAFGTKK
ncbi:MAG: transferrin-binding protein-like solute binding protein [Alphaproteobacteria bacterium]|nr:transferrin-binding protein-like solute binding protein [Alphaproteobacteria bacterium]